MKLIIKTTNAYSLINIHYECISQFAKRFCSLIILIALYNPFFFLSYFSDLTQMPINARDENIKRDLIIQNYS